MCKLDGTKCDTCYEVIVHSPSGLDFVFTYDERDGDNEAISSWLLATESGSYYSIRAVGDTVWSVVKGDD